MLRQTKRFLRRLVQRPRPGYPDHWTESYSKENRTWRFQRDGYWVGGRITARNLSGGYHAILQQWWTQYLASGSAARVLLASEGHTVKEDFSALYPSWEITTTDKFHELQSEPDIVADLCEPACLPKGAFDLVICQATLEHVYDPFGALKNLFGALSPHGIVVIHTHPPGFQYHSYPRDYFRFMKDWWYDLPEHLGNGCELLELYMVDNQHVFACYRRGVSADSRAG